MKKKTTNNSTNNLKDLYMAKNKIRKEWTKFTEEIIMFAYTLITVCLNFNNGVLTLNAMGFIKVIGAIGDATYTIDTYEKGISRKFVYITDIILRFFYWLYAITVIVTLFAIPEESVPIVIRFVSHLFLGIKVCRRLVDLLLAYIDYNKICKNSQ